MHELNDDLVSVCMATYNGEKYIKKQLDSIRDQTYKNIELLVQDDCSSDNVVKILESYQNQLSISIYKNNKNIGYSKNFESILKKAKGSYIAICDQDDIWEKDKIEILLKNIGNATLIYSDSLLIDQNGKSLKKKLSTSLKNNFISTKNSLAFLKDNCVSGHAMLFKKELLNDIFPFSENVFFDAWIAANAACINGVKFIDKYLVQYRQHDSNTLSKYNKKSTSLGNKIVSKAEKKSNNNRAKIEMIESFLKMKKINQDSKELLRILKNEYEIFDDTWFNVRLFQYLLLHQDKLYEITKKNRIRLIFKESIGYKLYKWFPIL